MARQVATWERFLNGTSLEERIMSRYPYELWFLTHLYFSSHPGGPFFRPVRSSTPPGEAIRKIAPAGACPAHQVQRMFRSTRRSSRSENSDS